MKFSIRTSAERVVAIALCLLLATAATSTGAIAEAESALDTPTREQVEAANADEAGAAATQRFDVVVTVPTDTTALAAQASVRCWVTFDVAASWYRGIGTLRTEVRGDISGITRCDGTPADPVKGTVRVRVTDFGVPIFGSVEFDADADSAGRNIPLAAAAQTDVPVYTFPTNVHGAGSLYEWEFRATVQSGTFRNDVCVEATAIDPLEPSFREVPC